MSKTYTSEELALTPGNAYKLINIMRDKWREMANKIDSMGGGTMINGRIRKLDGEYWVEINHEALRLLFKLVVSGKMATKALDEVIAQAEESSEVHSLP